MNQKAKTICVIAISTILFGLALFTGCLSLASELETSQSRVPYNQQAPQIIKKNNNDNKQASNNLNKTVVGLSKH